MLKILSSWGGVDGSVSGFAYKVLDADGNILQDWTNNGCSYWEAEEGVKNDGAWTTHDIPADPPVRFTANADLSGLMGSEEQTVQVVFAFVPQKAAQANNGDPAYVDIFTLTNVIIPAKAN